MMDNLTAGQIRFTEAASDYVASNMTEEEVSFEHAQAVDTIKWVAYSVVAYVVVGVGILGNLASLVVLTRLELETNLCKV